MKVLCSKKLVLQVQISHLAHKIRKHYGKSSVHSAVRKALEKEGWTITDDPLNIESGGVEIEIDLAAQKFIIAEKELSKIIVEIKSFNRRSLIYDFHSAIGQYVDYRGILKDENFEQILYLAIPEPPYNLMVTKPFYNRRFLENKVNIIIVDIDNEIIKKWIIN